ncbi:hypothetical protein Fcan01_05839 [Folsomia candida]|uniref:Chitin-binding type-2 domain-containing protein n=1 Tax=Folsomia candida TaxID=158441 RepID=A0A226EUX7_FOLCA|nr:hypothetical protein Fcan01_05839 [Folsomia candida]
MKFISHRFFLVTLNLAYFGLLVAGFRDDPPQFNYETLPKTSFSCKGKVIGRYYPDPETDCQLFHVCVKMSATNTNDFKFLCPNGTTFDQDHQVCMDYYQVACHEGTGTNPLATNYELLKLSSINQNSGLDSEKISFVNPDVADRNTLGDDFQVDEYNNNRLATSQNTFFQSSKPNRKPSSDIFYKNFDYTTKYTTRRTTTATTTTTPRRPSSSTTTSTTTTAAPLLFRSPIPSNAPNSASTKRKPNLETYESYEIESVAGLTPQNSFNRLGFVNGQNPKHYDYSYEAQDPEPVPSSTSTTTTTTTTTHRPLVFHNTFRSPLPFSSSTATPPIQTFQQQASRFNDDFFRKLPSSSTETSVSKAAQFYVNSNTKFSTPSVRQPTTNPFFKSTTQVPFSAKFQSDNFSPSDRGLSSRGSTTYYETSPSGISSTPRNHAIITDDFNGFEKSKFSSQTVRHHESSRPEDDVIRPRSYSGNTNVKTNQVVHTRQNNGFSAIPPPTTAETYTFPSSSSPTTPSSITNGNHAAVTYFQRFTTEKPEKSSIFFSKSTTHPKKDYSSEKVNRFIESDARVSTADYNVDPTSTYRPRDVDAGFGQKAVVSPSSSRSHSQVRLEEENAYPTSTPYSVPETSTTTERPQQRRGTRRRVNRPKQHQPQNHRRFDPELKYSRRIEEPPKVKSVDSKDDELFDAEASQFPGRPSTNLFSNKEEAIASQKDIHESSFIKATTEAAPKLAENYGRRIKVNTRRTFVSQIPVQQEVLAPVTEIKEQSSTVAPRRLIKRLKVKVTTTPESVSTTPEPTSTTEPTTTEGFTTPTTTESYHTTLRPVKRISIKTKVGSRKFEKDSEFKVPPVILQTTSSPKSLSAFEKLRKLVTTSKTATTTTTPEPELVTASDDDILIKKLRKFTTSINSDTTSDAYTTPTTFRPFDFQNSSIVVKVTQKTQKSAIPTPISFKEPILPNKVKQIETSRVEVKHSVREDSTKSPDYDYAYYNSDDDYTDASSKLDSKNYGKKPVKKAHPSPA